MGGKDTKVSGLSLKFEIRGGHPDVCSNNYCLCDIKVRFELTLRGRGKTEGDIVVESQGSGFKMSHQKCAFLCLQID
jgi:hypothetical protein